MISASGSELQKILSNPAIDTTRTCSNNVIDTYETFGIEAARSVLIEELSIVLQDVAKLDKRHISLLVDRMVGTGRLLSVNMLGMNGYQNGPLTKASFERISKELLSAAVNGDIENITGLASNIIVGQAPPCGTGIVNVSIDENMYNNVKFNKVEKTNNTKLSTKSQNTKIHSLIDFNID
jgi:DNA-directed RNA polymerase II subunit RPB1